MIGSSLKSFKFTVDGYCVGDRLLQDINFDVFLEFNGKDYEITNVIAPLKAEQHLETINMDYWLGQVRNYAEDIIREDLLGNFEVEEIQRKV